MKILILISVICLALLFVGGPNYYSPRSYKDAWDLGHILFFSILTYLLLRQWQRISKEPFLRQCIWVFFIALSFGVSIELLQLVLDSGTPSFGDLIRNLVGCLAAFAFFVPSRKTLPKTGLRILQLLALLMVFLAILPLTGSLIDEAIARKHFPVLADFETPLEIGRWSGDVKLELDEEIAAHGKYSLKIHLTTALYSGVGLRYFPGDWRGFRYLAFSIFNYSSGPLEIVCRVHDKLHYENGEKYDDRFNTNLIVPRGWKDIKVPLETIAKAPRKRKMDLAHIQGLGLFAVRLPQPEIINIDYVRLVK